MSGNCSRPVALAVLAKWPRAGRVKTRLCPTLDPEQAADLAAAALADTFDAVMHADVTRKVAVLDGSPQGWSLPGLDVLAQRGKGLADRLAHAFLDIAEPTVLIGMDTPQIDARDLEHAADALLEDGIDAVLGPADDGGYWSIGLREPCVDAFDGVPMSRADTCAHQRRRFHELGLRVALLPGFRDVDDIADARAVAAIAPQTQFARQFSRVARTVATCA